MKLRKLTAVALAAALTLSVAAPALAAESADAALARVTLAVKNTLGIGDEYTAFYGEPNETPLGTKWELSWSAEEKSLHVSASDEGKVLNYNLNAGTVSNTRDKYGPSFPELSVADARATAEAFLSRVLTKGESVRMDDAGGSPGLNASQYGFGGTILLNGIPTPMSFRVWVRVADGQVSNFWRGDESDYVGSVPAASSVTTADEARAQLAGTLNMELIYVRDKEGQPAVLRYVRRSSNEFYVDAATGKLVDLTELRQKLGERGTGGGADKNMAFDTAEMEVAASAADRGLSSVELAGVAKLEGVLSSEELERKVRTWSELKLGGYSLAGCTYSVEREPDEGVPVTLPVVPAGAVTMAVAESRAETAAPENAKVTARMTFSKLSDERMSRRTVTVDARTGELVSMSGYNGYEDKPVKVKKDDAQKNAQAFLKKLWGAQLDKTEVYESGEAVKMSDGWSFTFAQKVNGYFFPENSIYVRVSAEDGAVMSFSKNFDDEVTFDSAEGLISLDQAKTAWAGTHSVELSYIAVPVALDLLGPQVKPLISAGYSYYNALKPGYQLGKQEKWYLGIDAKTGKPAEPEEAPESVDVAYDDIAGHWAERVFNELAEYNVGWYTPKAMPDAPLTQIDLVALLCSADGYRYIPGQDEADGLYEYAIRRGLLTREEREDDKALTRADMIKLLLDCWGYKTVAGLRGIFKCGYADAAAIPESHMGYAALAQGLGLVSGDEGGSYAPGRGAVRSEAAMMLWRYMKR